MVILEHFQFVYLSKPLAAASPYLGSVTWQPLFGVTDKRDTITLYALCRPLQMLQVYQWDSLLSQRLMTPTT